MEKEKNTTHVVESAAQETLADAEAAPLTGEDAEIDLLVKFRRPYTFEGQEYAGIDLHGLEDTTAGQLQNVGRSLLKKQPGLNPSTLEMTMEFASMLAAKVTGKPLEFFERLPAKEAMKVKTAVVGFLYGGDGED